MGSSNSKLNPKDIDELMRITNFNGEELNNIFHTFRKDHHTTFIDRTAFVQKYNFIFSNSASEGTAFTDHVFRLFDINQDGLLNFREFVVGLSLSYRASIEDKLFWIFKLYDINHSGDITIEEMTNIMECLYSFSLKFNKDIAKTNSKDVFMKLDADYDGKVTWKEFRTGILKNHDLMKLIDFKIENSTKLET